MNKALKTTIFPLQSKSFFNLLPRFRLCKQVIKDFEMFVSYQEPNTIFENIKLQKLTV